MLRPRIITSLLIQKNGLVKTEKFQNPKYLGDAINAVKILSEKGVDELVIFDIDASVLNLEPNYSLLKKIAKQARMPVCYGGGIKTVEQAQKIIALGIEKIAISTAALNNPKLVSDISTTIGSQSLAIVFDLKKKNSTEYEIVTNNGKKSVNFDPLEFALRMQGLGAGEIIINNVDRDGTFEGYDWKMIDQFKNILNIPLTILGGASSLKNMKEAVNRYKIIGIAAASLFVFIGRYRAVLINYPNRIEKENLFKR